MASVAPAWSVRALVPLGDLIVVLLGVVVAAGLWHAWLQGSPMEIDVSVATLMFTHSWLPPGFLLAAFWLFCLWAESLYDPLRMISSVKIMQALVRAAVGVLVLAIIVQFFASNRVYSRFLLLAYVASTLLMLGLWRVAFLRLQSRFPMSDTKTKVVVIGTGQGARLVADRMGRHGGGLYELVGFVSTQSRSQGIFAASAVDVAGPVLGGIDDFKQIVNNHDVRMVILASRSLRRDHALRVATLAGEMGLRVLQTPFTWGLVSARVEPAAVGELELVQLGALEYPSAGEQIKRAFDIIAVLSGGIFVLPIVLVTCILIKLEDGGPILYAGKRSGRGGRAFPFFKFRSMIVDADKLRAQLQAQNESDGRLFKMTNDPRITRVGRFIRKWSIDELPQLLNVLRGDMNLVGPRPLPMADLVGIEQDAEYAYWFQQRSRVCPGITGLWQVSGRSSLGFQDMVELDVQYVQNWSLLLDIQILLKTIPAVVARRGAH